ncbi:MAG: hypothetical protein WC942_10620 [Clostridia bacterium]|jgi:hypothetical protein
MPYIKQDARKKYDEVLQLLPDIETKGDLEYVIFVTMLYYMRNKEHRYSQLHDCVYAVKHSAEEFKRKYLDKREDKARKENGGITIPVIEKVIPEKYEYQILCNKAQCLKCNSIIESTYRHDFKSCKCGNLFVDGGLDYMRRGCRRGDSSYKDLSKFKKRKIKKEKK